MAEEQKEKQSEDNQQNPNTDKKKLIFMLAGAGALFLIIIIISIVLLLGSDDSEESTTKTAMSEQEDMEEATDVEPSKAETQQDLLTQQGIEKAEAVYFTIRPVFVVNLLDNKRAKYLQINVEVMSRSDEVIDDVMDNLPLIKNGLVDLFSNQSYQDLKEREGREKLRQDALGVIQQIMLDETGRPGIESVLFTSFVMQ